MEYTNNDTKQNQYFNEYNNNDHAYQYNTVIKIVWLSNEGSDSVLVMTIIVRYRVYRVVRSAQRVYIASSQSNTAQVQVQSNTAAVSIQHRSSHIHLCLAHILTDTLHCLP